ncbi:uncharacterized protein GBIM_12731 [Gryllus bimaculatus]|nr:uncharacterized protein GBIM_12731 [Gryllus bimaculatus]
MAHWPNPEHRVEIVSLLYDPEVTRSSFPYATRMRGPTGAQPATACRMRCVCYWVLFVHFLSMSAAFLYIFPARVLRRTITMHVKVPEDVPALVLLNAALWGFFSLQLFWAPASVAVRHLTCRVGRRRQDLLNAVLFPARDAVLAELRALRNRVRQREAEQLHPLNVHNFTEQQRLQLAHNASKNTLFQTIKCVMAIKRQLKRRREKKEAETIASSIVEDLVKL